VIFTERQKNHLVVCLLESLKITETNKLSMNTTESPLCVSTKVKVEGQPSPLEEEWKGVSMHVEDFEPEVVITSILSKWVIFEDNWG